MIWIILFGILGICIATILYFTIAITKHPFIFIIIGELCVFIGMIFAYNYPIDINNCVKTANTYYLDDIAEDYNLETQTYVFKQYNSRLQKYEYKFLPKNINSPHYGTIKLYINKTNKVPIITIYNYEQKNKFWSFKSTNELTYSKIYISPKDIYCEEKE